MTRQKGERGAVPIRSLLLRVLGLLVLVAAWVGLVLAAIGAGRTARDSDDLAWVWVALACLGAVVVLAFAITVGARLVLGDSRPSGGKHR